MNGMGIPGEREREQRQKQWSSWSHQKGDRLVVFCWGLERNTCSNHNNPRVEHKHSNDTYHRECRCHPFEYLLKNYYSYGDE